MLTPKPESSLLLLIDFQTRLAPAINGAEAAIAGEERLAEGARLSAPKFWSPSKIPKSWGRPSQNWPNSLRPPSAENVFRRLRRAAFPKG